MELLFVAVIAGCLGAIVRYLIPGRKQHGVLLLPAVGIVAASVVWVGLLWAGLTFDGGWIWVTSLGASVIAAIVVAVLLPRARRVSDRDMQESLSHT